MHISGCRGANVPCGHRIVHAACCRASRRRRRRLGCRLQRGCGVRLVWRLTCDCEMTQKNGKKITELRSSESGRESRLMITTRKVSNLQQSTLTVSVTSRPVRTQISISVLTQVSHTSHDTRDETRRAGPDLLSGANIPTWRRRGLSKRQVPVFCAATSGPPESYSARGKTGK